MECIWYAYLRVGRALYANLRIVRFSWPMHDSTNERGSFKLDDDKFGAFVCKRRCDWSTQQSYQHASLNDNINRLMWPGKGAIPLKQGAAGLLVVPSLTGAGTKTIHIADLQSVTMGWEFCLEENTRSILEFTTCIRNNYELSGCSVCHCLFFPMPRVNHEYIWKRSLTQRTLVEWLNSIFLCISMVNEHWCGITA